MSLFERRGERLVEVEVLPCPSAAYRNAASPLRRGTDAAHVDLRTRQRLVQIGEVRDAQARRKALVQLAPAGLVLALVGHRDDPGSGVGGKSRRVVRLVALIPGDAKDPKRTVPHPALL